MSMSTMQIAKEGFIARIKDHDYVKACYWLELYKEEERLEREKESSAILQESIKMYAYYDGKSL